MVVARKILAAFAVVLLAAHTARATSISFTDVFNPADVFFQGQSNVACAGTNGVTDTASASKCESLTWTQTLPGFNSASDTLTSGTLTLTLYNDLTNNNQTFNVRVDLLVIDGAVTDASTIGSPNTPSFNVLSQLADGTINVTLTGQNGRHSFFFAQSQLDATADRVALSAPVLPLISPAIDVPATPVPEPATLVLTGVGLLAMAKAARRRTRADQDEGDRFRES